MGVMKSVKRAFSFKKKDKQQKKEQKNEEPTATEEGTVQSSTGNPPKRSNSMVSLLRKMSTLRREKTPKAVTTETYLKSVPVVTTVVKTAQEELPEEQPKNEVKNVVESIPVIPDESILETLKAENAQKCPMHVDDKVEEDQSVEEIHIKEVHLDEVKPDTDEKEDLPDSIATRTITHVKVSDISDELNKLVSIVGKDIELLKKFEPETTTEVLTIHKDRTETTKTDENTVQTVEVEKERQISGDGSTVVSTSSKKTTTTVLSNGNGIVKTEVKQSFVPNSEKVTPQEKPLKSSLLRKNVYSPAVILTCVLIGILSVVGFAVSGLKLGA